MGDDAKRFLKKDVIGGDRIKEAENLKKLCEHLDSFARRSLLKINLFSLDHCIINMLSKLKSYDAHEVSNAFDQLGNAFYCLARYALNLCRNSPNLMKNFGLLKTYTGYYTGNILSVMNGCDREILEAMGYKASSKMENEDEFILDHVNELIIDLTLQLFLSKSYCRTLKGVIGDAIRNKTHNLRTSLLDFYHINEITGLQSLCDHFDSTMKGIKEDHFAPPGKGSVGNKGVMNNEDHLSFGVNSIRKEDFSVPQNTLTGNSDDLDDNELYGGPTTGDSQYVNTNHRSPWDRQEVPGIYSTQAMPGSTLEQLGGSMIDNHGDASIIFTPTGSSYAPNTKGKSMPYANQSFSPVEMRRSISDEDRKENYATFNGNLCHTSLGFSGYSEAKVKQMSNQIHESNLQQSSAYRYQAGREGQPDRHFSGNHDLAKTVIPKLYGTNQ